MQHADELTTCRNRCDDLLGSQLCRQTCSLFLTCVHKRHFLWFSSLHHSQSCVAKFCCHGQFSRAERRDHGWYLCCFIEISGVSMLVLTVFRGLLKLHLPSRNFLKCAEKHHPSNTLFLEVPRHGCKHGFAWSRPTFVS